jgi:hypothetical protein
MNRQKAMKGIFGISIVLGLVLIAAAVVFRFTALPDLAKILPKDGTEGFFMVRTSAAQPVLKSNPYANLPWVNALGWAEVDKKSVTFLEVNSSQEAENYLQSLQAEDEQLTSNRATRSLWSTVTCYPVSKNPCFTWMGDLLILSDDENLLETLQKVASGEVKSLKNSPNYQNLRSRLPSWSGGFVYMDLQKILPRLSEDFKIFEALLELYPAFGASLKPADGTWSIESFLAVDKSLIENAAYWHPTEKYEAKFLPWTPDNVAVEWGGRDLGSQMLQMETLLQKRTPEGADLFQNEFQTQLQKLFGSDLSFTDDIQPLLDGEQYFGFTPSSDFLFLTSLDSEDELNKALQLKDRFAANYLYAATFQTPEGEIQARLTPLTQTTGQYQNYQYYSFTVEDEEVATVLFTESMAIVSKKQATAFETLDRMEGRSALRSVDSLDSLLSGSNELFTVHCLLLPDGSILKALLGDFDTITTARKLFDDGIFARSIVRLLATHD